MRIPKIGEGKYILYLNECPDCGADRILNREKLLKVGAFSVAGIGASLLVGAPVMGMLAAIGLIKLAIAGSISVPAAVHLIKANYKFLEELRQEGIYKCPNCGSSKLVKIEDILSQETSESFSNAADKVITRIGSSIERPIMFLKKKARLSYGRQFQGIIRRKASNIAVH